MIGFYDWIRNGEGQVVGVRETFSEEFEELARLIPNPPYARKDLLRLELFFSEADDVDPVASSDQDFLMNRLMRNERGEFALTFGIDGEVEDDIVAGASSADWIRIESVD